MPTLLSSVAAGLLRDMEAGFQAVGMLLAVTGSAKLARAGTDRPRMLQRLQAWLRRKPAYDTYVPLVAEFTSDLIALLDIDGRYCYVSPSHKRLLGYEPAALVGRKCREIIHSDDLPDAMAGWGEALYQRPSQATCRVASATGNWCWIQVQMKIVDWQGERLMLLAARDITAEREQATQLMQMQRSLLMGNLASTIIHDLNNMLTVVENTAGMAAEDVAADSQVAADLAAIRYAGRHAGDLTRNLLSFVRGRSGHYQPLNLSSVIQDIQPLLCRITGKHINLNVDLEAQPWLVPADRVQIEQVIVNLVLNARDAVADGGVVTIRTRNVLSPDKAGTVRLEVSDTGKGIPHELREDIFKPFVSTKLAGGTGLGLASCRWIVDQMGGTIEVVSLVGQGTTFAVVLPRVPALEL